MDYDRYERHYSSDSDTSSLDIVLTDNEEEEGHYHISTPYQNNNNEMESLLTEDLIFTMENISNSDLHSIATEEEDLDYLEYRASPLSASCYSSPSKSMSPIDTFYSPCPIIIQSSSSNYQNELPEEEDDGVMLSRSLGALEMGDYHEFSQQQFSHHGGYSVLGTSLPNDVFGLYNLDFEKFKNDGVSMMNQTSTAGEKAPEVLITEEEVPLSEEMRSTAEKEVSTTEKEIPTTTEQIISTEEPDLQDEPAFYEELPLNKELSLSDNLLLKEEDTPVEDEDAEKYEDTVSESSVTKDQDSVTEKMSNTRDDDDDNNDSDDSAKSNDLTTLDSHTEDALVQITEPEPENTVQVKSSQLQSKEKTIPTTTSTTVSIINNNQASSSTTKVISYSESYYEWYSASQNYPYEQINETKKTFMKKNNTQPNKQKLSFFVFKKTTVLKVIGLSFSTVFKNLQRHFYDPTILSIRYLRPLNIAYITFQNHHSMMKAIQKQDGTYLEGMMIACVPSSFKEMTYDANLPVKFKIQNFTSQITRTCVGKDCIIPCVFQYTPVQSYSSFTRYFIIKPKLMREVHFSSKYNYWYTNKCNFEHMNRLFKNTEAIYFIFSVTGSKSLQGYACMKSSVINIKSAKKEELIGTPFSTDKEIKFGANGKVWQYVYRIEWLMHGHVGLNSLSDLRNSWNSNSTVKTSVDYTQLEPSLGRFILQKFHI